MVQLEAAALADGAGVIAGCDLVINCTPLGLAGSATEGKTPLSAAEIPPNAAVVDIVANPLWTPLLLAAKAGRHGVLGGLAMLVHQGALSFTLWTGRPAPVEVMMRAARDAMAVEEGIGGETRDADR